MSAPRGLSTAWHAADEPTGAHALAQELLSGGRYERARGVAQRAARLARAATLPRDERRALLAAAWLHDLGRAIDDQRPAVAGARALRSAGHEDLARLVAHHADGALEARLRGEPSIEEEFEAPDGALKRLALLLDIAAVTTADDGAATTPAQRLRDLTQARGTGDVAVRVLVATLARVGDDAEARRLAEQVVPTRPRAGVLASAATMAIAVLAVPAIAGAQVARFPLETKSGLAAARIAVDPSGTAAALYPAPRGRIRLQLAIAGRPAESVPAPRGSAIEGLVLGPGAQPFVAIRDRVSCSPLAVMTRTPEGGWAREPLGIRALSATIAAGPDGAPGVLAARCDGSLSFHTRDTTATPPGTPRAWPGEQTGVTVRRLGRLSLAVGLGGVAVAGVAGTEAVVQIRGAAGWVTLPFPVGTLTPSETAGTVMVGLDAAQRPVALTIRGPRRRSPFDAGLGSPHQRAAHRYDLGVWERIPTVADPILLASGGASFALLDQGGNLTIETATGTTRIAGRPLRLGLGVGGLLAQIQLAGGAYELQVGQ